MTPALEIVGTSLDANNVFHGFLRTRHGKFTVFDAPDAGTGSYQGTGGLSVNPEGLILGESMRMQTLSGTACCVPRTAQ